MVQTKQFKMHPKLLHDTISRQAGTLEKAILEGCMNGREAGGTLTKIGWREKTEAELFACQR